MPRTVSTGGTDEFGHYDTSECDRIIGRMDAMAATDVDAFIAAMMANFGGGSGGGDAPADWGKVFAMAYQGLGEDLFWCRLSTDIGRNTRSWARRVVSGATPGACEVGQGVRDRFSCQAMGYAPGDPHG